MKPDGTTPTAHAEIAIAAGDLRTARAAAEEAEQIVDSYKIGDRRAAAFDATVHFARGQILVAEKDWPSAIAALKHARDTYTRRMEGVSLWVVKSADIVASDPADAGPTFAPAEDKVYRHPTFYDIPDVVKHI